MEAIRSAERSILETQSRCPLTLEHHTWSWVIAICRMWQGLDQCGLETSYHRHRPGPGRPGPGHRAPPRWTCRAGSSRDRPSAENRPATPCPSATPRGGRHIGASFQKRRDALSSLPSRVESHVWATNTNDAPGGTFRRPARFSSRRTLGALGALDCAGYRAVAGL